MELINVFVSGFSLVLINSSLPASDAEKQIAEQTVSCLKSTLIPRRVNERVLYIFTACGIVTVWEEEYYHM